MLSTLLTPIIVYNSIIFITFATAYKQVIMMKKISLLFFIFILTLLGSGSAWADETVETYDFQAYSSHGDTQTNAVTNYGGASGIKYNSYDLNYLSSFYWQGKDVAVLDLNGRIAAMGEWNIRRGTSSGGLYSPDSGDRPLSILNLCNGDKVSIYTSGTITFRSSNAKTSSGTTVSGTITSGEKYIMTADGHLDLLVTKQNYIDKIVITHTNGTPSISFDTSGKTGDDTYNNVTLPYYSTQLSKRDFTEPTLTVFPSTASVTYSVENYRESVNDKAVAIMNDNPTDFGDVMFKNIGWCKVTATATIGGTAYSASYLVWVWDNLAEYTIEDSGKKYKLTGAGVLANRYVTAVTGMEMGFGNINNNSAVVINQDNHFVSYMAADNGWWDRYPYDNGWPSQGTYYTFKATADGVLTFGGYKSSTGGSVIIKNTTTGEEMTTTTIFDGDSSGHLTSGNITMKAGQTYYTHGTTLVVTEGTNPWDSDYANLWAVFELEWFKFVADFKIVESTESSVEASYGMASTCGATAVTSREVLTGVTLSQVSVFDRSYKGSVQSADVAVNTSTGALEFTNITYKTDATNGKGGAIKVTLKFGESYIDYVMTIPYGEHVWDFRKDGEQGTRKGDWTYTDAGLVSMMNSNGTDWSRVFKVASKSGGVWTELIDPIIAARGSINGNNAFYMDNTAGLVFVTGPESFGAHETSNSTANYSSLTNDQKYNLSYTTTSEADLLWMKGTATIYFPGVTAGQYIKIYTYRHSDNKGETYSAKNLVDLDNVAYDGNTNFKMRGMWEERYPGFKGDNIKGCAIFRVPSNYTPTQIFADIPQLTLCDDGWVKIYRIEIMDKFEPDLIMTDDNSNNIFYPVDYDGQYGSVVIRKNGNTTTPITRNYLATTGQTQCQHANTCDYEVIAPEGAVTVNRTIWNSNGGVNYNRLSLTFNKAGRVRIIQRERANTAGYAASTDAPSASLGYVIDKNEYYINVGELTVQNYPYTWDFTNHNMYQGSSATKTTLGANDSHWVKINNDDNIYQQQTLGNVSFGTGDGQIPQNLTVPYSYFAQGAQLSNAAGTAIAETEGLGITSPTKTKTLTYFATVNDTFGEQTRTYEGYDLANSAITINGNWLTGVKKIMIPEVPNGYYIFISVNSVENHGAPIWGQIKAGDTTIPALWGDTNPDIFGLKGGVYCYIQNSGSTQDVTIPLDGATGQIKEIAVTNIVKSINELGYASESRNHAIDHTYQAKFTKHPVKAYAITQYNGETDNFNNFTPQVKKSANPISVVPEGTGVVLYQKAPEQGESDVILDGAFSSPLFYPAVNVVPTNDDTAILNTNWMRPSVTATTFDSETETWNNVPCTRFIMTRKYYTYTKNNGFGEQQTSQVEAFYRLIYDNSGTAAATAHNTIGANKAYLLVPTANVPEALWNSNNVHAPAGIFFLDLEDITGDNGTTAIDDIIRQENESINGQDVYYSLSGVRIVGTPTTKGIYIKNGKKVSIK